MRFDKLILASLIFFTARAEAAHDCAKHFDAIDRRQMSQADGDGDDLLQMGDVEPNDFQLGATVDGDPLDASLLPDAPAAPKVIVYTPPPKPYKNINSLRYAFSGEFGKKLTKLMKHGGQETEEDLLVIANRDNLESIKDRILALSPAEAKIEAQAVRHEISLAALESNRSLPIVPEAEVQAARRMEKNIVADFPNRLRATDEEVIAIRKEYPLLGKQIDDAVAKIKELKLKNGSPEGLLKDNDVAKDPKLVTRITTETDPVVRAAIEKVWARLNDPEAFGDYVRALAEDAAVNMKKSGTSRKLDALARGELVRNSVMEVLVDRHKANGNDAFAVITNNNRGSKPSTKTRKTGSNDDFRAAVGQGPFFDKPFDGVRHGIDTHFLQIEYVADAIWESTGGQPKLLWDYLGSKKGIRLWVPLFDNFSQDPTFTSPEYTAHQVSGLLKITD